MKHTEFRTNSLTAFATAAVLALGAATIASAQTTKEEMLANRAKMGSNYYTYEVPTNKLTKAPSGYKPFYISHYGRHGSRFHQPAAHYSALYETLAKADTANALTPLGKSLLDRARFLNDYAVPRAGDLTQLGVQQHQGIIRRMVKNFPEVFADRPAPKGAKPAGKKVPAHIDAYASTSIRCIVSMAAALEELRALKPGVDIHQESSGYLMKFINPANFGDVINAANTPAWQAENSKLYSHVDPTRMMRSIFSDTNYIKKNIDPGDLLSKIYEIGNNLQNVEEIDFNFDDLWTDEELFARWQAQNAWWYSVLGACPLSGKIGPASVKPVLQNILDMADSAIAKDASGESASAATLRFGHDTAILPLAALMQLELAKAEVNDMQELYKVWTDFKIIPMAANMQIVLYKAPGAAGASTAKAGTQSAKPVLVKLLYNEVEQTLPVPCGYSAPVANDASNPAASVASNPAANDASNPAANVASNPEANDASNPAANVAKAPKNCPAAPYYRWEDFRAFYGDIAKN